MGVKEKGLTVALQTDVLVPLFRYAVLVQSSKKQAKMDLDKQVIYWGKCVGGKIRREPEEDERVLRLNRSNACKKERKKDEIVRVLGRSAMLRKFQQSQWRVLNPQFPIREALCLQGTVCFSVSAVLSHWLGSAGGSNVELPL